MRYSEAVKEKILERLIGPNPTTQKALSRELKISQSALSKWVIAARERKLPGMKPRRPEDWSPEERLSAVIEGSNLPDAELGEFLRRKGLHHATLLEWKAAAIEALAKKPSGHEARRIRELERELQRKEKALAEAAALLILQKKVRMYLADEGDDTTPKSGK
jgi:transposase-like protein